MPDGIILALFAVRQLLSLLFNRYYHRKLQIQTEFQFLLKISFPKVPAKL